MRELAAGPVVAEATFLFVDMVGSTQLLASVGDAANDELRRDVFEVLRRPLRVFGGVEVKSQGDGLMVVFQGRFEDAVAAAVAMQQGVVSLDAAANYVPLAIRVGLARGEATAEDGDWFGTAVVEAARLCALAAPGQILLTNRSLAGARSGAWPIRQVGALSLKGFPSPVSSSEVVWSPLIAPSRLPVPPALALVGPGRLVDRNEQLEVLRTSLAAVGGGDGQTVLVSGPPGAGCTRLVAELVAEGRERVGGSWDPLVLWCAARRGRVGCSALGDALRWPVWWGARPLGEAIESVLGSELLVPSLPVWRDKSRRPAPQLPVDYWRAAQIVERGLAQLTKAGPVIFVVEDLQWGDEDMLSAVAAVFSMRIPGVLQIATFRSPDTVDSSIGRVLVDKLRGLPHVTSVGVGGLNGPAATELLGACGVEEGVARRWAGEIVSRVGDMPGQIVDAARRLRQVDGHSELAAGAAIGRACPYKGLLAFQDADSELFFGRDHQIEMVVDRLRRDGFVILVGGSGSGKSSLLRAGVGPALVGEDAALRVTTPTKCMGEDAGAPAAVLMSTHWEGLIVDQFEEAFIAFDGDDRTRFLADVVRAVDTILNEAYSARSQTRRWMAIAVRADFYANCAAEPRLAQLVSDHTLLLGQVDGEDVRAMIEGPARIAGVTVETGLPEIVAADVKGQTQPLPLLSQALHEAWRRKQGDRISIADYRDSGGVSGATAAAAERVYTTELSSPEQTQTRRLLLRLVDLYGPGDRPTRRTVRLVEAQADTDQAVIDRLVAARLIVVDEGTITLAHEALLEAWPRMRDWIAQDQEHLVVARRLSRAATDWDNASRPDADLYRGARLDAALALRGAVPLSQTEGAFLGESLAVQDRERTHLVRTNRRLRRRVVAVAVATVVSVLLAAVAVVLGHRASTERNSALTELRSEQVGRLATESQALAGTNIDLASLLAVESYRLAQRPDTLGALETVLRAEPAVTRVVSMSQLPPDATPLTGDPAGSTVLYESGENVIPVTVGSFRVGASIRSPDARSAAVAPDGHTVAVTTLQGTLLSVDLRHGALVRQLVTADTQCQVGFLNNDDVGLGCNGNEVDTANLRTGKVVGRLVVNTPGAIGDSAVATDPSHQLIAVAPDTRFGSSTPLDLVSATSLATMRHLVLPVGGVTSLAFQPGGHLLAVGTSDHGTLLVDSHTGRQVGAIGPSRLTAYPVFSPNGRSLAIGDNTGTINVYDVASSRPLISPVTQSTSGTILMRFSPDSRSLYELFGREAIEIRLDGSQPLASAPFGTPGEGAGTMTPDGHVAYSISESSNSASFTSIAYDPRTGRQLGPSRPGYLAAFSSDGRFAIGATATNRPDTVTAGNKLIALSHTPVVGLNQVDVNRSLTLLLSIAADQSWITLEQLPDMRLLPIHLAPNGTTLVASDLSSDGSLVARAGTTRGDPSNVRTLIDIARVENGQVIAHYELPANSQAVTAVAFSPDNRSLAVGDAGGSIGLLNLVDNSFQPAAFAGIRGAVQQILYAPDGMSLMAGGSDGSVWWWDSVSHEPIGSPFSGNLQGQNIGSNPAASVAFSFNWILTAGTDGLRLWNIDTRTWPAIACQRAGRNLTRAEWQHYVPSGVPYQPTCPGLQPSFEQ